MQNKSSISSNIVLTGTHDSNELMARRDISKIFKNRAYASREILVIVTGKTILGQEIIPTLCMYMSKGKIHYPDFLHELYNYFLGEHEYRLSTDKGDRIYDVFVDFLEMQSELRLIERKGHVAVFSNKKENFQGLENIFYSFKQLRNNSANLLNAARTLSIRDVKKLSSTFSKSSESTAISMSKVLADLYGLRTFVVKYDFDEENWEFTGEKSVDNIVREKFEHISLGKPIYLKNNMYYYLIFPFTNDKRSVLVRSLIVMRSLSGIKKYVIRNLTKTLNYYFDSYLVQTRMEQIAFLQGEIINIQRKRKLYVRGIDPEKVLAKFCNLAFSELVETTNAYSATLRLHNPFNNTLKLINEEKNKAKRKSNRNNKDILVNRDLSVNAFTFRNCLKNSFFYCKELSEFKSKILDIDRLSTRSELCFPVYFKEVKIGTINFESPSNIGFGTNINQHSNKYVHKLKDYQADSIINYFISIKHLVEQYFETLFENNDKLWLARRIHVYQNLHELKNILLVDGLDSKYKSTIEACISLKEIDDTNRRKIKLLKAINDIKDKYFINHEPHATNEDYGSLISNIKVSGSNNVIVTKDFSIYLDILLRNLFSNYVKHQAGFKRGKINISVMKDFLIINHKFVFKDYDKRNLKKYFVRPFQSRKLSKNKSRNSTTNKSVHYGLFLIGMIARHLGGRYYFDQVDNDSEFVLNEVNLLIKIPVA